MKNLMLLFVLVGMLISISSYAQKTEDKGQMIIYTNEFWEEVKKSCIEYREKKEDKKPTFKMKLDEYELPKSIEEFDRQWYNDPVSQAWSGMCWCFCTTSYLESELNRIHGKKIKISELHTVYWEYVEKARRFVQERGNSLFAEGSEANAVTRIWSQYGCVPADVFTGLQPDQKYHDHSVMFQEMNEYLKSVKENKAWNETIVLETIKSTLNHYLGEPPTEFTYNGKKMTPKEFFANEVKLNMDDYVDFMSLMQEDYWTKTIYDVPDNWWKSRDYYNIPLDDFMNLIKNAIKNGYTMSIGGDVSETGYNSHFEVAVVPDFDIPYEYIDENARQFRFSNHTTTDDHGIHIVGWKEDSDGMMWFLIKDSGSGARNGANKGYYFFREDYVKLKMMSVMMHKDAAKDVLSKIK
jgi:bleomycin hydrolase